MKKIEAFHNKLWFLIPAMIGGLISACGFGIWMLFVNNEIGSSIVANSISLVTMIVTGITLVFLYKTLKQQQEQIDKTNQDVEYNRIIDIFYKQLEYSKFRLFKVKNLTSLMLNFIENTNTSSFNIAKENKTHNDNLTFTSLIFKPLSEDLQIYNEILSKTGLSNSNKILLMKLIIDNIFPKLYEAINAYQSLYRHFQESDEYKRINDKISTCIDIEWDFGLILEYLYITPIEGLKLSDDE